MDVETVVFVSFENHFAPCGGLSAVMRMLPPAVSKYYPTILITPFFKNIPKSKQNLENGTIKETGLKGIVFYKGYRHTIEILYHDPDSKNKNYRMYFIQSEKFFLAGDNPYIDTWRPDGLFHDSYFLSKCIPVVLDLIKDKFKSPYMINLQDWETALTIETMETIEPIENECVLTIHNPYDNDLMYDPQGRTILQYTIPKMKGLSTVSEHYAYELTHDTLQSKCMAWKLQGEFKYKNIIGINNGNFVDLHFPESLSKTEEILAEKKKNRKIFNDLLHSRSDLIPQWGNRIDLMRDDMPIFMLFGRDEPKQKGFDVAAASIYRLLKEKGTDIGYFIFTLIPGVYGLKNLAYFQELCAEFGNNVMVFPFRLSAGYLELQRAASFIIMPSYYEPFGAANEGYANGTPVIARATGGLIQQVCPINFEDLPEKYQKFVTQYHNSGLKKPTGYLYREHPSTETAESWTHLLNTEFDKPRSIHEPVDWRNPIFWSMVTELQKIIEQASIYYKSKKEGYCSMITNGIELFKEFSWDKSARKYISELYKLNIK